MLVYEKIYHPLSFLILDVYPNRCRNVLPFVNILLLSKKKITAFWKTFIVDDIKNERIMATVVYHGTGLEIIIYFK